MAGTHAESHDKPGMEIGVSTLPPLPVDLSDRNRTSPFAFTGNKFEFRAVGSSQSIAPANISLNAAVACALDDIASEVEGQVASGVSLNAALQKLLPKLFKEHAPVIFNGNGYTAEWPKEAEARGLPNYTNTVDVLLHYSDPDVMQVFLRHNILTEREILSRQEILFENYAQTLIIEGDLLIDMIQTKIMPAAKQTKDLAAQSLLNVQKIKGASTEVEEKTFKVLAETIASLDSDLEKLIEAVSLTRKATQGSGQAILARDNILPAMSAARSHCDKLERLIPDKLWVLPKYQELLWIH